TQIFYKTIEIVATVEELEVMPLPVFGSGFLDMTVYPNPTLGTFWIEVLLMAPQPLEVMLLDPNGNEMETQTLPSVMEHILPLNLLGRPAGAYPLVLRLGEVYRYVYIIKQ
ncbi:MAG: hypothetical protein AAFU03_05930, partial [Bacteroidota bacterium]